MTQCGLTKTNGPVSSDATIVAPPGAYRGIEKNNDWLHDHAAALDLRRLLAVGLTTKDGASARREIPAHGGLEERPPVIQDEIDEPDDLFCSTPGC
jgi:hypothetical protein